MKKHFYLLAIAFCCCFQTQAQAVVETTQNIDIEVTYAQKLGTTKAIRDLVPAPTTSPEKRNLAKTNRKAAPPNFANRREYKSVNPNRLPTLEQDDALWQKKFNTNTKTPATIIEPKVNIEGIYSNFGAPHDPSGDIGKDHYVEAINATTIAVYTKQGELVQQFAANTIWSSIGFQSAGDPIVLYDQEYDRWLITEFPFGNQLLVAISETSDPLGAWTAYNFATPNFPDYPKYGMWSNAYTVTTNEEGPSSLPIYFIDREAMLNGEDNVKIIRTSIAGIGSGPGFQLATPVDWSGLNAPRENKPIFLTLGDDAWGANVEDRVQIHEYSIDFDLETSSKTTTTVNPSPFDTNPCSVFTGGFSCMPQAGGGGLDGIPEVIMNQAHYRNFGSHESIVLNFLVDVTAGQDLGGIRWIELRRVNNGDWEIYQEGTFAPNDGKDRFMGAMCMDGAGNIGLAYAISSPDTYASLGFTGRRNSDPLGEMTVEEYVLVEGGNTINSGARFGDYFQMGIDPTDDRTFWFVGEYAGGGGVRTRVAAFELTRDSIDLGASALITPKNADDLNNAETVTVQITNFGLKPQTGFKVGYIFENGTPVISETINQVLQPEETFEYTFTQTVNMQNVDDYQFKIFSNLQNDAAPLNDTLRVVVSKLARFDASISNIAVPNSSCGTPSANIEVELVNLGTENLTSAFIGLLVNGIAQAEFIWQGNLAAGESVNVPITINNLLDGENTLQATASFPNNNQDERPQNNTFSSNITAILNGQLVEFELTTDDFPTETSWELKDENNNVIYTGGPYNGTNTIYTEQWCLAVEKCYTFTITDAYGDGICCLYGEGSYSATNPQGEVLFTGGEFGVVESKNFCTEYKCLLGANFDIMQASDAETADGTMIISPSNGIGPFQYSIDGGTSFQESNIFTELLAGTYQVIVQDAFECNFVAIIDVPACTLAISVAVANESFPNANDGEITITAVGGTPPYQYSIDGGNTFTNLETYQQLANDTYNVVVTDASDCQRSQALEVIELNTGINDLTIFGQTIEVFPNPTNGVVSIHLNGYDNAAVMLDFEVYDISGKRIQNGRLVRYNQTYKGQISLVAYPSGIYFVRFNNSDLNQLLRIVKN